MPSLKKEEIYHRFFTKNLSPKDCVEIIVFFSSTNFVVFSTKIWKFYVFLLYISLLFLKFGKKFFNFRNLNFIKKRGGGWNPLWWRPRGQTLGKGSMILFHGFNSQVKDQNPKTIWHVTCDLCTRLCLEWKNLVFFHLHSIHKLWCWLLK